MRKLQVYSVAFVAALGLAACGDDSSDFSARPEKLPDNAVLSFDDLSNCTAKKAGALEFVKDTPYVCVESGDKYRWEKVSQTEDEPEDFKVCNKKREGQYALASEEEILYACSDEEWIPVGGVSSSSGKSSSSSENAGSSSSAKSSDSGKDAKSSSSATSSSGKDAKSSSESSSSVSSSSGKSSSSGGTSSSVSSSSVTSSSEVRSSSSIPSSFSVGDDRSVYDAKNNTLTDYRDGQVYRTVTIGEQTWMAENLNFAYLVASDSLDSISVCYKGDSSYCSWYGRLYTWAAAMDSAAIFSDNGKGCGYGTRCYPTYPVRGACPKDWHLPTQYEWTRLIEEVGDESEAGRLLKSTKSWFMDEEGTDAYEFSVLPAGMWSPAGKQINGWYNNITRFAYFWTATERSSGDDAYGISFYSADIVMNNDFFFKYQGYSVRCVKD
ncbi:MAG: fibrobacter succinogenes major paralogous domain-containing protein [Fibrobacter sp.]|nr:fibrobacter succinogenes major paralogous domain-containing protein [Fibrobacter sp.]